MTTTIQPVHATIHKIETPGLDPILVVMQDIGDGQGRIIIECFGIAWSAYWGAMGMPLRAFLAKADTSYIVNALFRSSKKKEAQYITRIVTAVKQALPEL